MHTSPISRRSFVGLTVAAVAACRGSAPTPAAEEAAAHAPVGESAKHERGLVPSFGPTYQLASRVVNLVDPGRFLRFTVAIEFAQREEKKGATAGSQLALYIPDENAAAYLEAAETKEDPQQLFLARIKKYTPAIDDAVISTVAAHTSDELAAPEGRELLKKEIAVRVQLIVGINERVTNVYFAEYAIQ